MKVILLKDVGGVGRRDEALEVADGYALNYLIARGLAMQATPQALQAHETRRKEREVARAKDEASLRALVEGFGGARIELTARATERGGLFKAITAADIKKAIGKNIPEDSIRLEKPIKEVGEHGARITGAGAEAPITVVVTAA